MGRRATHLRRDPWEVVWAARQTPPSHHRSQLELVSEAWPPGTTQPRKRK